MNPAEWAEKNRYLSSEAASKPGRYSFDLTPFWREPLEQLDNLVVSEVIIMAAAQTGKTETINNAIGYFIGHEPSPILMVQPTLDLAETWSKTRLAPMIRDCPILANKVADHRTRDSGNTVLSKIFTGGSVSATGANSAVGLRQRPIRILALDEVDGYPDSAGTEGDPIGLAIRRTDTFDNARIIKTSTPTLRGLSRIEAEYEKTDQRKWHVPCPHCKSLFVLMWRNVIWEKDQPETAHIVCPDCEKKITDEQRIEAIKQGQWIATRPFKGRAGFFLNGINSIFPPRPGFTTRLHQGVETFLEAKRMGREKLQEWTNTYLAETFDDEESEALIAEEINRKMEARPEFLPNEILVVTCAVDVQANRIEAEVVGWCENWENYGLQYKIIPGNTAIDDVWQKLDEWLLNWQWEREDGAFMRINACGIDSGHEPGMVYRFCYQKADRRIFPLKGFAGFGHPLIGRGSRTRVAGVMLYRVGVDETKLRTQALLKTNAPGAGYCHFFQGCGYDMEYFKQLTAEKLVKKMEKGRMTRKWKKIRERNEAFDIRGYNIAAIEYLQPDWQSIKLSYQRNSGNEVIEKAVEPQAENVQSKPKNDNRAGKSSFTMSYLNGL